MKNIGLTDSPATKDQFNIETYIEGLSDFIVQCDTPMTISIQGSWGSGKTSIMNMVQNRIQDRVIPVFFNTWQFSQFSLGNALPISMIRFFLDKISGDTEEKKQAFFDNVKKYGGTGVKLILNACTRALSQGWLENPFKIETHKENSEQINDMDFAKAIDNLHNLLQETVSQACENEKKDRVVVFIDDLDRLVPSKAMELLEVLKIFFDCNNCVFVLAIDYDVVIRGASEKYGFNLKDKKEAEKGKAFFDKIIQVPFKMPVVEYDITAYLKEGLTKINISPSDEEMPYYQMLCAKSLGTNPRGLKRILNAFLLLTKIRVLPSSEMNKSKQLLILFGLLCMQQFKENIYNLIVRVNRTIEEEDATPALWLIAALCTGDNISKVINKKYNTDISEEEILSFRPFFFDFLKIIDVNPQSLHFLLNDSADDLSEDEEQQRQEILDKNRDSYMQLNELFNLSATTSNDNSSTVSFSEMKFEDMNKKQKRNYKFWTKLKEDALNNKNFVESGLRFIKLQDQNWMPFGVGKYGIQIGVSFSVRKHTCGVSYFFSKKLYQDFYNKQTELENDLGLNLNWTDPSLDRKSYWVGFGIDNVDFDNEEQMKVVNNKLIELMAKFKNCIQKYID